MVNVIEESQISPRSGSVLPASLPLTIFDMVWLPWPPVQRLFFYEHHCSKNQFTNTILPNIKHSLSLALQHFFPLAGNLTWPEDSSRPEIRYLDGDSVSFTVAESGHDFDVLVSNEANDAGAFDQLVPQLINLHAEKRCPLTSFQVTLFPEQGISIGITYNHVVADGRSILHFIKTWASICQSSSIVLLPPCLSRSLVKEEPDHETDLAISNYFKNTNFARDTFFTSNCLLTGTDKVFATFVMGRAEINRLKQWVLANINREENQTAPPFHLSTFVLTCAYVWVCSIKAKCLEPVALGSEENEMECFGFSVDCRARLDPPLPATYFGTCLSPVMVRAKASDLIGERGILIAVERIGNAIQEIEDGIPILKQVQSFLSNIIVPSSAQLLSVAGSAKFSTYDTDFGWGKPKKSRVISISTSGAISLSECPSEIGAVEIGFARNKVEMDAFISFYRSTIQAVPSCN